MSIHIRDVVFASHDSWALSVCINACLCARLWVGSYVCVCAFVRVFACHRTYLCLYVCISVFVCVWVRMCACGRMCACTCVSVHHRRRLFRTTRCTICCRLPASLIRPLQRAPEAHEVCGAYSTLVFWNQCASAHMDPCKERESPDK